MLTFGMMAGREAATPLTDRPLDRSVQVGRSAAGVLLVDALIRPTTF